jgi:hypothetical protein
MLAATLGSHDRAAEHFAAASVRHRQQGIAGWEARNLLYAARSLVAAGVTDRARETAEQAAALAGERGYGTCLHQARELLETLPGGVTP